LDIGSSELICGLFLELAKRSNPILKDEAIQINDSDISWARDKYAKGVKRCIKIYLNALDPDIKEERIKWIRDSLPNMDLHLLYKRNIKVSEETILAGSEYRNCSWYLSDSYTKEYDYNNKCYFDLPKRYRVGPYTDGCRFNHMALKNTLQEAEVYGLADVAGKIAYYLDAPRMYYYFTANERSKALEYFRRYLRRIIDSYALSDENKFMTALNVLLTSYTEADCLSKDSGNFQFNKFIKHYLYHDYNKRNSRGRQSWFASSNQYMKVNGRNEYMKEIWDRHLDVAAEIAVNAKIQPVTKAIYHILKDSPNSAKFIEEIELNKIIKLSLVGYQPLAKMFKDILKNKIDSMNSFNHNVMLKLIGYPDDSLGSLATDYFKRTNGAFTPEFIADFLMLDNLEKWLDLFEHNLESLDGEKYLAFIRHLIEKTSESFPRDMVLLEKARDILHISLGKIKEVSAPQKKDLLSHIISVLSNKSRIPEWLAQFLEEVIFSLSYEELENLLGEIDFAPYCKSTSARNKRVISIFESIKFKTLPPDSMIIDIQETGTSKMLGVLISICDKNREGLQNRLSTLLIMLESPITGLNEIGEKIFDNMTGDAKKKLHSLIIDSPHPKTYMLGLKKLDAIYKDLIPGEFIIQMLEHGAKEVKAYISDKINSVFDNLESGNKELFIYYIKTLLLLPNKNAKSKERVYSVLPQFVTINNDKREEIESMLLDIGSSNIIIDSERALVTLAKIRKDGILNAG
ncbi:MAG: hypothetical protein Q8942_14545, partial [Bacillota bacterium]|nr:hypothetical protein [Bacillota bacterium]